MSRKGWRLLSWEDRSAVLGLRLPTGGSMWSVLAASARSAHDKVGLAGGPAHAWCHVRRGWSDGVRLCSEAAAAAQLGSKLALRRSGGLTCALVSGSAGTIILCLRVLVVLIVLIVHVWPVWAKDAVHQLLALLPLPLCQHEEGAYHVRHHQVRVPEQLQRTGRKSRSVQA